MKKLVTLSLALLVALPAIAAAGDDEATPGYLGVQLQPIEGGLAEALEIEEDAGVLVSQVMPDSPAEAAGLKAGDILVSVNGEAVGRPSEVTAAVRGLDAGDEVEVEYLRRGEKATATALLAESPRRHRSMRRHIEVKDLKLGADHGYLGVATQPLSDDLAVFFGTENGGALVSEVMADSPAEKLGLKAGDVITGVDGKSVEDPQDLRKVVGRIDDEREVEIAWVRDKKEKSGTVQLEVREGFAWHNVLPGLGGHHGIERWFGGDEGHRVLIERSLGDADDLRADIDDLRRELDELREELQAE